MPVTRRPPIYLITKKPLHPKLPPVHVWACDEKRLVIARFAYRRRPLLTAVVHRSTKYPGKWQGTHFHNGEPTGDFQGTCQEILRELNPGAWRLLDVRPRR